MKDLTQIPLEELHILKTHAYQTLAKLERLLGGKLHETSYEQKDFIYFGEIYKHLEEEMNDRILKIVDGK